MSNDFEQLFEEFLRDDLSPDELKILLASVKDPANADAIRAMLKDKLEFPFEQVKEGSTSVYLKDMFRQMLLKAEQMKHEENEGTLIEFPSKRKFFTARKMTVAASILFMVGLTSYLLFFNKTAQQDRPEMVKTMPDYDVEAPKVTKAMITLSDGTTVAVDSLTSLAQGSVNLVRTPDGKIIYSGSANTVEYNTLTNPRGSKVIDITLADGSHVWLNAGSSVTYPVAFAGNKRKVTITGEAYFEVAHDKIKPFYVGKGDMMVTVLGTKFNVNAYDDESDIKVTLLEGSVKVSNENGSLTIKPNQQVAVSAKTSIVVNSDVNVDAVVAWKNGLFSFGGADIKEVMRQLGRWYDLEVSYAGIVPVGRFKGEISKDLSLSQVLNILTTTRIHYKMEGRNKIIIMPEQVK